MWKLMKNVPEVYKFLLETEDSFKPWLRGHPKHWINKEIPLYSFTAICNKVVDLVKF